MGVFGVTKKELFHTFNEELNGIYKDGRWGQGPRIELKYNEFIIYLDVHIESNGKSSTSYTRMRVCFKNASQYEFKITKEGFFSKIGKFFGMKDIQIGDDEFDGKYIIKSNDELNTMRLLSSDIKRMIYLQKKMNLMINNKKHQHGFKCDKGESVLSYMVISVMKDIDDIKNLIELFKKMIDKLLDNNIITTEATTTVLFKEKE